MPGRTECPYAGRLIGLAQMAMEEFTMAMDAWLLVNIMATTTARAVTSNENVREKIASCASCGMFSSLARVIFNFFPAGDPF